MTYTAAGAHRRAARQIGISESVYLEQIARGNRHCGRCKQWRLAEAYFGKRTLGSPYYQGVCRPCRAENERERQRSA